MKKPTEITLKYKQDSSNVITMMVDPINDADYQWQYCKSGTANWENINTTGTNTYSKYIDMNLDKGDKYRCLIFVSNKVTGYSRTLTVGRKHFQSRYEYEGQHQWEDSKNSGSSFHTHSVSDTDGMDGLQFERYCANILRKNGFEDVCVTQGSGDYGIDILAKKSDVTYAIQCKCYSNSVGNKAVQEAYSGKSFYNCMVAAVLTNNYFTEAAIETARRTSVILWNRDYLDRFIKTAFSDTSRGERTQHDNSEQQNEQQKKHQQERKQYERKKQKNNSAFEGNSVNTDFFAGCKTWEQVKTRYRELIKMYHPDQEAGDSGNTKIINEQYELLRKKFNQ